MRGRHKKCSNPLNAICHICGKEKPLNDFYLNRARSNGKSSQCKVCAKVTHAFQEAHPIKRNVCIKCGEPTQRKKFCSRECYYGQYIFISPDGITSKKCTKCKEIKPVNQKNYHRSKRRKDGFVGCCKICKAKSHKHWRESDPVKEKARRAASNQRNIENRRAYTKKRQPKRNADDKSRKLIDPSFALKNRVRSLMYNSLRHIKNGRKWQDLVGYSVDDLRGHIEKQFKNGMNWDRFLSGEIHIDHKIPITAFNFIHPEDIDFKKCWSLNNLQPMWASDNISKGNKLNKPFQPALAIGAWNKIPQTAYQLQEKCGKDRRKSPGT